MNEQQLVELKRIKGILSAVTGLEDDDQEYIEDARKALQSIISQDALDKMAEDARTVGLRLDYEPPKQDVPETNFGNMAEPKIGCVNHDCDKCKAVQEPIGYLFQHEETGLTMVVDVQQVEWGFEKNNPRHQKIGPVYTTPPAAPVQEPVAWVMGNDNFCDKNCVWTDHHPDCVRAAQPPQPVPVKTYHDGKPWPVAPKPWVGLTDEDKEFIELTGGKSDVLLAELVEAKLKEKNT
jgi:hypothetical protein